MSDRYLPTESEKNEYLAYKSKVDVILNMQSGLNTLQKFPFESFVGKYTLICGGMAAFDRGLFNFLSSWNIKKEPLFLLSEVTAQYRRYTKDKASFPFICTPHLLAKEMVILHMQIDKTEEMNSLYNEKKYIREAVSNLEARHLYLGDGYAIAWSYYAYQYIVSLLEKLKPKRVILWNEFYAFHHIIKNVCKEKKIEVIYMEFGCVPGTIAIDKHGQQGESEVALKLIKEKRKFIPERIGNIKQVINFLKESGLNRNKQPEKEFLIEQICKYKIGRPIITFMEQNDYESGLYPYSEEARKFHSPIFQSSQEAAKYIECICKNNNWNFIYKPHPIMKSLGHYYSTNEETSVTILDDVNINSLVEKSDVVITILSQSAYISLIQEIPVVMLGYTQLKGKSCCYEAFKINRIESTIKRALKHGYTKRQKKNFNKHIKQMLEYNLYDDLTDRTMRFGKQL